MDVKRYLFEMYEENGKGKIALIKKYAKSIVVWLFAQNITALLYNALILAYISYSIIVSKRINGVGKFAGLVSANSQLMSSLYGFFGIFSQINNLSLYADKIKVFFDSHSPIETLTGEAKQKTAPLGSFEICLNNVSFSYANSNFAIRNLDLKISPGEKIAIVGENGVGKSTLVKLLLRLYDVKEGEILFNGLPIGCYDVESLRRKIGVAFQSTNVYALSFADNLQLYKLADDLKLIEIVNGMELNKILEKSNASISSEVTKEFSKDGIIDVFQNPCGGNKNNQKMRREKIMYVGDKNSINLSSSKFANFIENNCLYVDKTAFIEHVLRDKTDVLLFTRPRRMGKSLNMNTLAAFLDCKRDTAHLFRGLHIESCPEFAQVNSPPVVYLDFVTLDSSNLEGLRQSFRMQIIDIIGKYLDRGDLGDNLKEYFDNQANYSPGILNLLLKAIGEKYQKEPYLIIDEYDRVITDTLRHREGDEMKAFIVNALQGALKGETHFRKAVLTGVTRTTKESLFSTLNNIKVYDILRPSVYDGDFSLTEDELLELVPAKDIDGVRRWYNNMRVGDTWLYNIYSVMNYLSDPGSGLKGYWSMSGGGNLLSSLWTDARAEAINTMLNDETHRHATVLDHHLNMEHLRDVSRCSDVSFYTLAVQAGYLTFEPVGQGGYEVFIPNEEAKQVWARLLLDYRYNGADNRL